MLTFVLVSLAFWSSFPKTPLTALFLDDSLISYLMPLFKLGILCRIYAIFVMFSYFGPC